MSINSDSSPAETNTPATEVEGLQRLVEEQRKLIDKLSKQLQNQYYDAFAKELAKIMGEGLGEFDPNLTISTETLDFDVLFKPSRGRKTSVRQSPSKSEVPTIRASVGGG